MLNFFDYIKSYNKNNFIHVLESTSGLKDVIVENGLMKHLDLILNINLLKEHGVSKIFKLETFKSSDNNILFFIIKPCKKSLNQILQHLNNHFDDNKEYVLIIIPQIDYVIEYILEYEGIWEIFSSIMQLPYYLKPIDCDLYSLELSTCIKNNYLWIAEILTNIQGTFGIFDTLHLFGPNSMDVFEILKIIMKTTYDGFNTTNDDDDHSELKQPDISTLVLFDRGVDGVTPYVTSLDYQNLLDLTFGLSSGFLEIAGDDIVKNKDLLNTSTQNDVFPLVPTNLKIKLANDQIFQELKDNHFSFVSEKLKIKNKELQLNYEKGQSSISNMKDFVTKHLKSMKSQQKSLAIHIALCESIIKVKSDVQEDFHGRLSLEQGILQGSVDSKSVTKFIENLIMKKTDPFNVLSILTFLCTIEDGIAPKIYQKLHRDFLHVYGYEFLGLWGELRVKNLIYEKQSMSSSASTSSFSAGNRFLEYAAEKIEIPITNTSPWQSALRDSEANISDSATFGAIKHLYNDAYTPLSIKLIYNALQANVSGIQDILKHIPSSSYEKICNPFTNVNDETGSIKSTQPSPWEMNNASKILVFFIGGCTYGEIASLRILSKILGREIHIATTSIINGSKLIKSMIG